MRGKNWTQEEVNFLQERWGITPMTTIAKQLNRTLISVVSKSQKLGLKRFIHQGEYVTYRQLIIALGYGGSYSYLKNRLSKLDFPLKYKSSVKRKYAIVYLNDFWKWAEQHKHDISFANFEKGALGEEPEWVDVKRKADTKNPSKKNHNRVWTKEEDNLLIAKLKLYKYTYADLSKDFNRTETAIKKRIYDLGISYRPVPRDTHLKCTDEENRRMIEFHNKGYDSYSIAKELGKTNLSICDRLKKAGV